MDKILMSLPVDKYIFSEITSDLARVQIHVYHNGYNPNGSFFEDSTFENSKESFKNKPLCGAYIYNDEGEIEDFKEHNIEEQPCGVIPETNNYHVETIDELKWAVVDGLVFKEYCNEAYELLKLGKKISMEIEVLDGFKGTDGFYHIKQFNLLCVTILGDEYLPAMGDNSTISLYTNSNSELFVTKFTEIINKVSDLNVIEGGNKVNRDEIIAKFTAIKNVEGYMTIVDNQELTDEELEKQLFALSQSQIEESIREAISTETIIKQYWDGEAYETQKYWLEDTIPSENVAILWCREDYKNYGVSYSMSGDKVTMDYSTVQRYQRGDWRAYQDGEQENPNPVVIFAEEIIEQASKEMENIKSSFNVVETEEYKSIEETLNTVKADFATLQSDKELADKELDTLREFQLTVQKNQKEEEVNSIFEEYAQLKDIEGYDEVIKDAFNMKKEDLIKDLKVFAFDNGVIINKKQKFTKKTEPTQLLNDKQPKDMEDVGAWSILNKHIKNQ